MANLDEITMGCVLSVARDAIGKQNVGVRDQLNEALDRGIVDVRFFAGPDGPGFLILVDHVPVALGPVSQLDPSGQLLAGSVTPPEK